MFSKFPNLVLAIQGKEKKTPIPGPPEISMGESPVGRILLIFQEDHMDWGGGGKSFEKMPSNRHRNEDLISKPSDFPLNRATDFPCRFLDTCASNRRCSSRDTACGPFAVGGNGLRVSVWILVRVLGTDFGADLGCGAVDLCCRFFWR